MALNTLKACAEDKSWRIRFFMADKIVELAKCMDHEAIMHYLSNYFANFLQDTESEVRTIAATRSSEFCKFIDGPTVVKRVIPGLKKLSTDSFVHVRSIFNFRIK
jgi:serine/threonine-protein phosphatase 2A regulatory subunit A